MTRARGTINANGVTLLGGDEIAAMREAGNLAARTLDFITPRVAEGMTTGDIDRLCHNFIVEHDAVPATLDYKGYPKSCCTSVNHVICHGIPSDDKVLRRGDIVNVDVTVILDGWHGDTSRMFYIGEPSVLARRLTVCAYESMMRAIEILRPGATLGDIGHAIQTRAESERFSVVREFCGHGLGREFHMPPNVLHYGEAGAGQVLEEGMCFTIEPMLNAGRAGAKILADGWTAVTRDRSLSAQFEHSVGITATGYEIFTLSPSGWHCPPYAEG
ncbi:MAG: type I methionyl aminopeptidase [Alphaproteobacteria bacterium]|nr:type I methionyl aminopeptidase [Alphaproteobacteria bacterium]MDA7989471.1 type I methionyl aminopeptidase [Alphaproteobacteria bacterium]MDA8010204.1 type I methionyl aminopeptidase [Alphaproteobacteria bacterium]